MKYVKECEICGVEFKAKNKNWKYCAKCRNAHKTKCHCDLCGRHINFGSHAIPIDSPERALCSFCKKAEHERELAIERRKMLFRRDAKPCEVCGKIALLVRHTKKCETCYFKAEYPHVTEVKEIGE